MLANVPVQSVECVVDGVEVGDFRKIVPTVVASLGMGEIGYVGASSALCQLICLERAVL